MNSTSRYVSFIATAKEHRGKGYARLLFNKVLHDFRSENFILHAVPGEAVHSMYQRRGFKPSSWKVRKFMGVPNLNDITQYQNGDASTAVNDENCEEVLQYDAKVCGYYRGELLRRYLLASGRLARCIEGENGAVKGYITASDNGKSYKMDGLMADDLDTAKDLLYEALWILRHQHGEEIFAFYSCCDERLTEIEKLLTPIDCYKKAKAGYFELLMYTEKDLSKDVDLSKMFSYRISSTSII